MSPRTGPNFRRGTVRITSVATSFATVLRGSRTEDWPDRTEKTIRLTGCAQRLGSVPYRRVNRFATRSGSGVRAYRLATSASTAAKNLGPSSVGSSRSSRLAICVTI